MWYRPALLKLALIAGLVSGCEGEAAMPVRLLCDDAALCPLFAEAVIEAHPEWQIATPKQAAGEALRLTVLTQDRHAITARLEWSAGNNPPIIGPEFGLSVMDREISAGMAKGFLLRLLDYSKVSFGW